MTNYSNDTGAAQPGDEAAAYRSLFLGLGDRDQAWGVVCTPIKRLFDQLRDALGAEECAAGWWPTARVRLHGNLSHWLVHTPQGSPCADLVHLCSGAARRMLFLGYCGGLIPAYPIGAVVAWNSADTPYPGDVWPEELPRVCVHTTPGFFQESPEQLRKAISLGRQVVDMETQWLQQAASQCSLPLQGLYLVTDQPLDRPLVSLRPADHAAIAQGEERLVGLAQRWLVGEPSATTPWRRWLDMAHAAAPDVPSGCYPEGREPLSGAVNIPRVLEWASAYYPPAGTGAGPGVGPDAGPDVGSGVDTGQASGEADPAVFRHFLACYAHALTAPPLRPLECPPQLNDSDLPVAASIPEALDQLRRLIGSGPRRWLLKPNWVSDAPYPETSDMSLLAELTALLLDSGATEVLVADDGSLFYDERPIFAPERTAPLRAAGATVVNLREQGEYVERHGLWVARLALEVDATLDCCCLKSHNSFGFSGAVKNLVGLLAPKSRFHLHTIAHADFHKAMTLLCRLTPVQGVLLDARQILHGAQQFRMGGEAREGFGLLVGKNPWAVDRKALGLAGQLGFAPSQA